MHSRAKPHAVAKRHNKSVVKKRKQQSPSPHALLGNSSHHMTTRQLSTTSTTSLLPQHTPYSSILPTTAVGGENEVLRQQQQQQHSSLSTQLTAPPPGLTQNIFNYTPTTQLLAGLDVMSTFGGLEEEALAQQTNPHNQQPHTTHGLSFRNKKKKLQLGTQSIDDTATTTNQDDITTILNSILGKRDENDEDLSQMAQNLAVMNVVDLDDFTKYTTTLHQPLKLKKKLKKRLNHHHNDLFEQDDEDSLFTKNKKRLKRLQTTLTTTIQSQFTSLHATGLTTTTKNHALKNKRRHHFQQVAQINTKYNTQPSFTADPRLMNNKKPWSNNDGPDSNGYNNNNNDTGSGNPGYQQNTAYVSPNASAKGVYTSQHFKIDRQVVHDYLTRKNIVFKHSGDKTILMDCPVCPKPTYGKPDNMWKCCIFDNGGFVCLRCQQKGSFYDFKMKLGDIPQITNAAGKPVYEQQQRIQLNAQHDDPDEYFNEHQGGGGADGQTTGDGQQKKGKKKFEDNLEYIEQQQQNQQTQLTQTGIQGMVNSLTDYPNILDYFENQRKIKLETLQKYKVGAHKFKFPSLNPTNNQIEWQENDCMVFPWTDRKSVTDSTDVVYSRVKARSITEKKNMRLLPKGGTWGFFGWHTIPLDAKTIIITEGELDAMSVHQSTGLPAISLPNGANSLPPALLPCLERFEKVILWLDDDQAGHGAVEMMSNKLGIHRTYHIPGGYGAKDANEALQKNLNIAAILDTSTRQQHKQIQTFGQFRHEVKRMFLDPNTQVGVAYPNMPVLQSLIKGHRRGELTILTGGTGVGKTTLLTQLSLELAMQGVNTLWGSFEIRNPRLVKTLLKQYAACMGVVLNEHHHDTFDYVADKFEELPFNFLKFYGSSPVQEVIEAMDYATYVHDVQHVILDNLQFMLSGQGRASGDKFDLQDRAIEAFRQFASQRNVHVTLVIHPRKEQDNQSLGLASVFGSAKATQEADNVMIIQGGLPRTVLRNVQLPGDTKKQQQIKQSTSADLAQHGGFDDPIIGEIMATYFRTIEIRKNRWDGDLGSVPLRFDKASSRFYELTNDDIQLGLGDFIAQQKKLKQMDLIKHINHIGGTGPQSAGMPTQAPRSGFQNFNSGGYQKGGYQKNGNNSNNGNNNNNNQQGQKNNLTPQQEFELHQQFQRERDDMMNHMLSDGEDAVDFALGELNSELSQELSVLNNNPDPLADVTDVVSSITNPPTPSQEPQVKNNVVGLASASPQAFALNNIKQKMHNDLEQTMHKTGKSSGDLKNHEQYKQVQRMEQQLQAQTQQQMGQNQFFGAASQQKREQQNQDRYNNNNNNKQDGGANPMDYKPTLDIIAE